MLSVLCLHGAQQTAEMFENSIAKLTRALADVATFHFIDAPYELPKAHAEDAATPRSWSCPHAGAETVEGDADADYAAADAAVDAFVQATPVDVLLGFSQGGLVAWRAARRGCGARAVVVAGCPDPRKAMSGSALLTGAAAAPPSSAGAASPVQLSSSPSPPPPLLPVPSLHVMGRRDAIVPFAESEAFAADCGPAAVVYAHDHAHSVPALESFFVAARQFLAQLTADPAEAAAAAEARAEELEMIGSMYGEECVRRPQHPGGAVVSLPLFSEDAAEPLRRLRLACRVPRLYPAAALEGWDVTGGPAARSVRYERWRAELLVAVAAQAEEMGRGAAVLLPLLLHASALAEESADALLEALTAAGGDEAEDGDGGGGGGGGGPASAWAMEEADAELRERWIAEAEEEAATMLRERRGGGGEEEDGAELSHGGKQQGGTWTLTIGLIGKPSAGKSTFFNAVTDPQSESEAARVAAFPFTTIEPNVGTGYGPLPCPCERLRRAGRAGFAECDATYGHVPVGLSSNLPPGCGLEAAATAAVLSDRTEAPAAPAAVAMMRRHPILVKDVAGLVRGAYQGKGKGNQFLNDLCDADVLVHVVDGAGATDAEGAACPPGQGSTLDDISWVRAEVHNWIYDNLRAKWSTVVRQPARLRSMFSGYRSSPAFVGALLALLGVGGDAELAARLRLWGPRELHRLVALYVQARFPTVVALNKADLPTAPALAAALRARYPHELFVAISAQAECAALLLRRQGLARYTSGETACELLGAAAPGSGSEGSLTPAQRAAVGTVTAYFGAAAGAAEEDAAARTTGVQQALAVALAQCAATAVFPVSAYAPVPSLKHCFTFRAGSTADTVFWALCYAKLLEGKLVRFEACDASRIGGGGGATTTTTTTANNNNAHDRGSSSSGGGGHGAERSAGGDGGGGGGDSASNTNNNNNNNSGGGAAASVVILKKTDKIPFKSVLARVLSNKRQME